MCYIKHAHKHQPKAILMGIHFGDKVLLEASPLWMEPMDALFHPVSYVIPNSTMTRSSIPLQMVRSISFSNETQMPTGTRQETQKYESSQVTTGKLDGFTWTVFVYLKPFKCQIF